MRKIRTKSDHICRTEISVLTDKEQRWCDGVWWGEGYVVPGGRRELEMFPHPTLYSLLFTLHVGITRTKGEGTSSNPEELPPVPVIELWCHPFRESTCEDTKIPTLPTRTQVSDRSLTSSLQRLPIRSNHHGCVTSLTSRPHAYPLQFSNN